MDFMLLPFAGKRVIRSPVGGIPIGVIVADPVNNRRLILPSFGNNAVDSGFCNSCQVVAIAVGVSNEHKLLRFDFRNRGKRNCLKRRFRRTRYSYGESLF